MKNLRMVMSLIACTTLGIDNRLGGFSIALIINICIIKNMLNKGVLR